MTSSTWYRFCSFFSSRHFAHNSSPVPRRARSLSSVKSSSGASHDHEPLKRRYLCWEDVVAGWTGEEDWEKWVSQATAVTGRPPFARNVEAFCGKSATPPTHTAILGRTFSSTLRTPASNIEMLRAGINAPSSPLRPLASLASPNRSLAFLNALTTQLEKAFPKSIARRRPRSVALSFGSTKLVAGFLYLQRLNTVD
ncbi:hypothetical protein R3P38DRAFT_3189502 [Favolaschia claudopus]|uniref:Uncharacterized protein n=1 Tax=Favolaschia claudopus TaxID=2862362 RepID=A0AAW0BRA8_9AGAR